MVSEKQIEAVQIVLGRYHHFASVAAIREALTAAEQAEPAGDAEPVRQWPDFVYDSEAEPNTRPPESRLREALEHVTELLVDTWNTKMEGDPERQVAIRDARAELAQEDGR